VLSYYAHPHGPCRGTIYIALSAVSSNANFCSINLDSGTATYHLKALTNEDFGKWMKIIRKYVNISKELQLNDPEYPKMTSPRQSTDFERRQSIYIKRQSLLLDKRNSLHRDPQSFFRLNNKLDEDLGKIYGVFNSMDNGFKDIKEILDHFKISVENPISPGNTRQGPNAEGKFRLKKFPLSLQRGSPALEQSSQTLAPMSLDQIYEKLYTTFSTLKTDKEQAFELLRGEVERWKQLDNAYRKLVVEHAELRKILSDRQYTDVPEQLQQEVILSEKSAEEIGEIRNNRTGSFSTINTGSVEVFFDAEDIELKDATDSDNEIIDEETEDEAVTDGSITEETTEEKSIDDDNINDKSTINGSVTIRRRKCLPSPVCGEDVSLLSILRKN